MCEIIYGFFLTAVVVRPARPEIFVKMPSSVYLINIQGAAITRQFLLVGHVVIRYEEGTWDQSVSPETGRLTLTRLLTDGQAQRGALEDLSLTTVTAVRKVSFFMIGSHHCAV